MGKKQSKNPMQYQVRSASGKINRHFRKLESAEAYFEEVNKDNLLEIIVLKDKVAGTIIKDNYTKFRTPVISSSNSTTPQPYIYHYKDGVLTREKLEDKKPENKFIKFIKRLFKIK